MDGIQINQQNKLFLKQIDLNQKLIFIYIVKNLIFNILKYLNQIQFALM